MHSQSLEGRVAVITGAASGIGRATALLFADQGAHVTISDLKPSDENDAEFQERGIRQVQCDVRREADIRRLIDGVVADQGRIDILVNNAGVGMIKPTIDVTESDWDNCIDTNLKGPFFGCVHAIRHMRASGGGAIVNTSSNAGLLPRAQDPVYSISKQALVGMTKSLALCHSIDKIRINAVCPGPVGDTGMMNADIARADDPETARLQFINASPMAKAFGRMIRPSEVAQAILYLCSDAAAMVTGTAIAIDGGKSLGVPPQGPA